MTTPVKPEPVPSIPTYDEWQAAQYGPHRFGQDPKAQLPMGRIPTYDEWQQLQSSANPSKLTFPALPTPKFVADQTKRLNPNAGAPDRSIPEQLGEHARHVAGGLDVLARETPGLPIETYAGIKAAAAITRQAVAPAIEHPAMTAATIGATAIPGVGPLVGAAFGVDMLHNVAKYGYQVVHEQMMSPEDRAIAQQDPNRISGEAALVQAGMLGLMGMGGVHALSKAADVSTGMMESGAAALKPYYTSPAGATELGTAAATHGLPATASPFPPDTPPDAAWREGYAKPRVKIPGTVEPIAPGEVAPPVTPEAAPSTTVAGEATKPAAGLTPIEGTGETVTRGLARSTAARVAERRGVEDDMSTLFGDLPEYRRLNLKDQSTKALALIDQDPAMARRIAMGDENPPQGSDLHPEAVFVALRNRARVEGDVGLIHDLATGGLTEQATTMGQRLRLLAENDPEDPVAKIRRIEDKRAEGRGAPKAIATEINTIGEHTKLNADILSKFIDGLRC